MCNVYFLFQFLCFFSNVCNNRSNNMPMKKGVYSLCRESFFILHAVSKLENTGNNKRATN